ncbi:MAG TPA: shikimate kinase [Candidatus Saccharimonadales bacterium]|nr:shikimate kinase [Candidatus Saccharimonadales bacterium]
MKIVLIGFMGVGKSSVAPQLAKKLGINIIEMDDFIEKKAGKTLKEIFASGGESSFRKFENEVCHEIANIDNAVISTGGGVVMNANNFTSLKNNSTIIELNASFDTILKRINQKIPRPLFKDEESAKKLYDLRKPLYEKFAQIKISTDNKSVSEVTNEIIESIKL